MAVLYTIYIHLIIVWKNNSSSIVKLAVNTNKFNKVERVKGKCKLGCVHCHSVLFGLFV